MQINLPGGTESGANSYINWTNNTAHAYLKEYNIEMGGQIIDTQYGHWLDVWNELTDHYNNEHTARVDPEIGYMLLVAHLLII